MFTKSWVWSNHGIGPKTTEKIEFPNSFMPISNQKYFVLAPGFRGESDSLKGKVSRVEFWQKAVFIFSSDLTRIMGWVKSWNWTGPRAQGPGPRRRRGGGAGGEAPHRGWTIIFPIPAKKNISDITKPTVSQKCDSKNLSALTSRRASDSGLKKIIRSDF